METDFGFRFHWKLRPPPPPNIGNSHLDLTLKNAHLFPYSGLQQPRETKQNVSQNQFNYIPCFPPAVALALNSPIEKFPSGPFFVGQQKSPLTGFAPTRKRFLVFDQSGDEMTLMYTSGDQDPGQFGAYQLPNPPTGDNLSNEPRDHMYPLRLDEDVEDNSQDDLADEMREDTEELNALLWSDSDSDFSDDDEVTSTAHSPSTMTDDYHVHTLVDEISEEVSFFGPSKRQKLYDGGCDVLSRSHITASSLKTSGAGSDAESSCSNCNKQCKEGFNSLSGSKRSRKEKIRGTLSILRTLIPDSQDCAADCRSPSSVELPCCATSCGLCHGTACRRCPIAWIACIATRMSVDMVSILQQGSFAWENAIHPEEGRVSRVSELLIYKLR